MSKTISTVSKSVKILGLMALLIAAMGMIGAAPSASAASLGASDYATVSDPGPLPQVGKLSLFAVDSAKGTNVGGATVVVFNSDAVAVVKGQTDANGYFATYLPVGIYKVKVFASGYKEFGTITNISANEATVVKAGLRTKSAPTLDAAAR
jgi:hypothetical protein